MRHALAIIARFGSLHFSLGRHQRAIALDDEIGRALIGLRHLLRDLRHAPLRRQEKIAGVFMQRTVEQSEQRRLAGAVAPDQADLLARIERH